MNNEKPKFNVGDLVRIALRADGIRHRPIYGTVVDSNSDSTHLNKTHVRVHIITNGNACWYSKENVELWS